MAQVLPDEDDAGFEQAAQGVVDRMLRERALDWQSVDEVLGSDAESYETRYIVERYKQQLGNTGGVRQSGSGGSLDSLGGASMARIAEDDLQLDEVLDEDTPEKD